MKMYISKFWTDRSISLSVSLSGSCPRPCSGTLSGTLIFDATSLPLAHVVLLFKFELKIWVMFKKYLSMNLVLRKFQIKHTV